MASFIPKVSVILPVYQKNNEYLDLSVESILGQSLKEFELIIIANNCDEKLWESLQKFNEQRVRLYRTVIEQIAFNLNYAINISKADLIARMDADDIAHNERIKKQYEFLHKNPQIDVVGTGVNLIDKNSKIYDSVQHPKSNKKIRTSLPYKNPFCHPTVMIRKSTLLKHSVYLGGFYSEDYSLWLRLARDNVVIFENIQENLLNYRISPSQTRGSRLAYAEIAGLLWTEFLYKKNVNYFIGAIIAVLKVFFSSKKLEVK